MHIIIVLPLTKSDQQFLEGKEKLLVFATQKGFSRFHSSLLLLSVETLDRQRPLKKVFNISRPSKIIEEEEANSQTRIASKTIIDWLNDDTLTIILREFVAEPKVSEGQLLVELCASDSEFNFFLCFLHQTQCANVLNVLWRTAVIGWPSGRISFVEMIQMHLPLLLLK